MPAAGADDSSLLSADEPAPCRVLNPDSQQPLLLVSDHSGQRIPAVLNDLGLGAAALQCHLAHDIGTNSLTRRLAEDIGATTVMQQYSRLVVDCNRDLLDPSAFLAFGDGIRVPGNENLSEDDKRLRTKAIYWPYHDAITREISRLSRINAVPAVVSIHSFTPVLNGKSRPWEMGILWDTDQRISRPMIQCLRERGLKVGDNEPYSGKAPQDFTLDHHAEAAELPHVGIEVRQNLIEDADGVDRIASALVPLIRDILARLYPIDIETRRPKRPA